MSFWFGMFCGVVAVGMLGLVAVVCLLISNIGMFSR